MKKSPFDDPYYREQIMRNGLDPREVTYRLHELYQRIDQLEAHVRAQPNVLAFVQVNYPEIIEQFELVQATKKKINTRDL